MDLELAGRTALITGGSRGIGRAIAQQLAGEGVRLALLARNAAAVEEAATTLSALSGQKVIPITGDTGDDASVRAAFAVAAAELGGIDILVNAAASPGGDAPRDFAEITSDAFWRDVNVKVMGYLRCAQQAAPHMIGKGWGRIINISGLGARQVGSPVRSIRNVGVVALTKSLANQLGPLGINVTAVHPGTTRTDGVPKMVQDRARAGNISVEEAERQIAGGNDIRRLVEAAEVAHVVTFLASPKSVAINGELIVASGGAGTSIYY